MRKKWEFYFMELAENLAERSTCDRAHVGALVVNNDNRIVGTGYNGSLPGFPHCDDAGHTMRDGHCIATVHAEVNVITYCAKAGISMKGSTMYVTHFPCINCAKSIVSCGIKKIFYKYAYNIDSYVEKMFSVAGIDVVCITDIE